MRLYNEILKKLGDGESALSAGARYTVLPGRGGYFQGVKTVSEFSSERVILGFRRVVLEIEGSGFVIEKYCDGDLELSGRFQRSVPRRPEKMLLQKIVIEGIMPERALSKLQREGICVYHAKKLKKTKYF